MKRFDDLIQEWKWRPIRNCPGRYVLADGPGTVSDLLDPNARISEHRTPAAEDMVLVSALIQGGIIAYARADGTQVITINTAEGFQRKLQQLGIALPESD
jgi:hypothetical protein